MLRHLLGSGRPFWALIIVALAIASVVEIVAPAARWGGVWMEHAGWVLGAMAALLALLTSVTIGLRVESQTSPDIDWWFLMNLLSWLLIMLAHGWEEFTPNELTATCIMHASYQLAVFTGSQFLLRSSPFDTRRLRTLVWGLLGLGLLVLLVPCISGHGSAQVFRAWRILNVVAGTALLLAMARALLTNGEARSWLILGGGLMAFGIMLTNMSAADGGVSEASPVHYMFAAYLLMLWLLVTRRVPSRSGAASSEDDPFASSFFTDESLPPASGLASGLPDGAGEPEGAAPRSKDAGDHTRRRIAQDLHDGVGSQIVSIISSLDPTDAQQRSVASALEQCLLDVKILVDDIEDTHENVLDALGRLRYRVQHSLDRVGISLVWDVDFEGPLLALNDDRSRQVLHVAQEALANVMRHSRATRVTVRCHAPPPGARLLLEIHDDGAGFEVPPVGRSGGKGLNGMRRRAAEVSGRIEILSEPGCGTLIRLSMPL